MTLLELMGFSEELPLGYSPVAETRDLRPPLEVTVGGRKRLIDFAVLDPIYGDTQ